MSSLCFFFDWSDNICSTLDVIIFKHLRGLSLELSDLSFPSCMRGGGSSVLTHGGSDVQWFGSRLWFSSLLAEMRRES